jgi:predicted dithiol-disulfide oxidoreductase (DUF899 family)
MPEHAVGTQEQWLSARTELLAAEKEHMRQGDELARRRRELPWVPVEKEYTFETDEGSKTLADLFDGRSQLLVYHFMFGFGFRVDEQNPGCTGCSFVADHFDGVIPHLNGHDVTLVSESIAPLQELRPYKERMGWKFPWVSSLGSDFRYEFGAAFTEEQQRSGADYNFMHVDQGAAARRDERVRPPRRSGPPHLLDLRARRRAADGDLRIPGRGAVGPQRGPPKPGRLVAPSRRV